MSNIEVKNVEGQAVGTVELSSDVFGIEPNIPVVHQVVVASRPACARAPIPSRTATTSPVAAASPTARRAPAVPARAPRVPASGPAAA